MQYDDEYEDDHEAEALDYLEALALRPLTPPLATPAVVSASLPIVSPSFGKSAARIITKNERYCWDIIIC